MYDNLFSEWHGDLKNKVLFYKAIADESRLDILLNLFMAGRNGMNVSEIADCSHLSRPAVSHHLKILKDSGLIKPDKKGTQIFYSLAAKNILEHLKSSVSAMEKLIDGFYDS